MTSLEQVIWDQVQSALTQSSSEEQTLESIKLSILFKVSQILGLPLNPDDFNYRTTSTSSRIVLSPKTLSLLDAAWNQIVLTFSDHRITSSEKAVREAVLSKAPFFTERKSLVQFINILVQKDSFSITRISNTNMLNSLLAIDGFRGILPQHYKNYIDHLSDRLSDRYKKHIFGVRAMYDYIDSKLQPSSSSYSYQPIAGTSTTATVTGSNTNTNTKIVVFSSKTTSTCRVFLALSNLYRERVGCRIDDTHKFILDKYTQFVSKFIEREKEYHLHPLQQSIHSEEKKWKQLKKIYRYYMREESELDFMAYEKLLGIDQSLLVLMSTSSS